MVSLAFPRARVSLCVCVCVCMSVWVCVGVCVNSEYKRLFTVKLYPVFYKNGENYHFVMLTKSIIIFLSCLRFCPGSRV